MTAAKRKTFRIEEVGAVHSAAPEHASADWARHYEVLEAISDLKQRLAPRQEVSTDLLERYRAEIDEARSIRTELDGIHTLISDTKRDMASLHRSGFGERKLDTVSTQLDAVIGDTEQATRSILTAAEVIDANASNLAAALKGPENEMAADIQDQVVHIFEACNFQDITGQRITKVVETLAFIERRVANMMEIWGGIESLREIAEARMELEDAPAELLSGPALDGDPDTATQDDIDALFD
ncbi:MAG: protein phosphatase CheZ [Hyphomicrobiales bacterium]